MNIKDLVWTEKYRPQTMDELIISDEDKTSIMNNRFREEISVKYNITVLNYDNLRRYLVESLGVLRDIDIDDVYIQSMHKDEEEELAEDMILETIFESLVIYSITDPQSFLKY